MDRACGAAHKKMPLRKINPLIINESDFVAPDSYRDFRCVFNNALARADVRDSGALYYCKPQSDLKLPVKVLALPLLYNLHENVPSNVVDHAPLV